MSFQLSKGTGGDFFRLLYYMNMHEVTTGKKELKFEFQLAMIIYTIITPAPKLLDFCAKYSFLRWHMLFI